MTALYIGETLNRTYLRMRVQILVKQHFLKMKMA